MLESLAYRVLAGPEHLRGGFIDDRYLFGTGAVGFTEITAFQEGNSDGREVSRPDPIEGHEDTQKFLRQVTAFGEHAARDARAAELRNRLAPGNRLHAGQLPYALDHIAIELPAPFR